jgi:hypothetical protein
MMSPEEAAALLQIPERGEALLERVERDPNVARAMGEVANGERPEGVAAKYDMTWIDGQEPVL